MTKSITQSTFCEEDETYELPLRPQALDEFVGQDSLRERLEILIHAAKQRREPLGHCLFTGPPGLGKTTLANILGKAMGTQVVVTSGPAIEKPGDLAGILTQLQEGDILFIDEIHQLSRTIEEYLYPAMEDFSLDLVLDSGPNARSVQMKLNQFTLAGATTRSGLLTGPLRSRFAFSCRLEYYSAEHLALIARRTARLLNVDVTPEGALEIAKRARGTPRIVNHLLRWVRDFAQIKERSPIDAATAHAALEMLAIDHQGLDELDIKLLKTVIDHYGGGPVGVSTLSVAVGEEPSTIEDVVEPYLINIGFIKRTPRGRIATHLAHQHLDKFIVKGADS